MKVRLKDRIQKVVKQLMIY